MLRLITKTAANKKLYKPKVLDTWKRYHVKPRIKACVSMSMARALLIPSPQTFPILILVATNKCGV